MAKITAFEGKFSKHGNDFVVYTLHNELIIRSKSGFTAEALKKDSRYAKSCHNAQEFGKVSSMCKQLRMGLKSILPQQHNLQVVNALTKKMHSLLLHDVTTSHGERTLAIALQQKSAQQVLVGYDFNPMGFFHCDFKVTESALALTKCEFANFENATHLGLQVHEFAFDFKTQHHQLTSNLLCFENLQLQETKLTLPQKPIPNNNSIVLTLLEVSYYTNSHGYFATCAAGGKSLLIVSVTA